MIKKREKVCGKGESKREKKIRRKSVRVGRGVREKKWMRERKKERERDKERSERE